MGQNRAATRTASDAYRRRLQELNELLSMVGMLVQDRELSEHTPDWADVGDLAHACEQLQAARDQLAGA